MNNHDYTVFKWRVNGLLNILYLSQNKTIAIHPIKLCIAHKFTNCENALRPRVINGDLAAQKVQLYTVITDQSSIYIF